MEQLLTFDELPQAVTNLTHVVSELKLLLTKKQERPEKAIEKLLTVQEAAEFLNLKKSTIYSKCRKDELPHFKRGRRLYFLISELDEYLQKGREKSNAETRGEAKNHLSKRPEKRYKLAYYLVGILFKKAIQVICDMIEIGDVIFLKTLFHPIVVLFSFL